MKRALHRFSVMLYCLSKLIEMLVAKIESDVCHYHDDVQDIYGEDIVDTAVYEFSCDACCIACEYHKAEQEAFSLCGAGLP